MFNISWAVVAHAFNPSTKEAEVGSQEDLCEIEASLVYRVSSRTAKTTERNKPCLGKTNKKTFYLLSFLTCICAFNNCFLLLNKECSLDPVMNTFTTRGLTLYPASVVVLGNVMRTLGLRAQTPQSLLGHTPHMDFGAFPSSLE